MQAIDHSFAGGPFAAEALFTVAPESPLDFAGIQAGADGVINLQFEQALPIECVLEFSNDLLHWSPLETLLIPSGKSAYPLPQSGDRSRFYRLVDH